MKFFGTCFVFDTLLFLGLLWSLLAGMDTGLWLPLVVGVPAAVLLGGLALKARGRPRAATTLVALLAVPGMLAVAFVVMIFFDLTGRTGHH